MNSRSSRDFEKKVAMAIDEKKCLNNSYLLRYLKALSLNNNF